MSATANSPYSSSASMASTAPCSAVKLCRVSSPAGNNAGASASGACETCSACGPALLPAVAVSAFITAGTWATVRWLTSSGMPHWT